MFNRAKLVPQNSQLGYENYTLLVLALPDSLTSVLLPYLCGVNRVNLKLTTLATYLATYTCPAISQFSLKIFVEETT